jgi:predicted cupin superfamily sugar epimerase
MIDADLVIARLELRPHREGGWYRETWRATDGSATPGARPTSSAILYLLAAGERSHWHRVDADEIWQFSAGGPLELRVWADGDAAITVHRLGGEVTVGDTAQVVVPAGAWQAARPLGAWTLVGCIVAPAFEFDGFALAAADWEPPV